MSESLTLECHSLPEVALAFMNQVHCEELALVRELMDALTSDATSELIDARLSTWMAHTQAHFAREERLMVMHGFPPTEIHRGEHERALSQLENRIASWQNSRDTGNLLHYITEEWRPWLQQHIETMDYVTARYLSQFDIDVDLEREAF